MNENIYFNPLQKSYKVSIIQKDQSVRLNSTNLPVFPLSYNSDHQYSIIKVFDNSSNKIAT